MIIDGSTHTVTGFGFGFREHSTDAYYRAFHNGLIRIVDPAGKNFPVIRCDTETGKCLRYKRDSSGRVVMLMPKVEVKEEVHAQIRLKFKYPLQFGLIR